LILDIAEPGYKMGERVIRPARVIVSRGEEAL
jgi:molecular chaperone GrpE (heat shock protein)